MALARWDAFSPRQADRLFGSVVRYWVTAGEEEIPIVVFACGCHYSAWPLLSTSRICRQHKRKVWALRPSA